MTILFCGRWGPWLRIQQLRSSNVGLPRHCTLQPSLPDVKSCIKDVGFLQLVQLHLGITHLVFYALQLIIQLQLLSLKFTVFPLIPVGAEVASEGYQFGVTMSHCPFS